MDLTDKVPKKLDSIWNYLHDQWVAQELVGAIESLSKPYFNRIWGQQILYSLHVFAPGLQSPGFYAQSSDDWTPSCASFSRWVS
jgi:hypothetical protein